MSKYDSGTAASLPSLAFWMWNKDAFTTLLLLADLTLSRTTDFATFFVLRMRRLEYFEYKSAEYKGETWISCEYNKPTYTIF